MSMREPDYTPGVNAQGGYPPPMTSLAKCKVTAERVEGADVVESREIGLFNQGVVLTVEGRYCQAIMKDVASGEPIMFATPSIEGDPIWVVAASYDALDDTTRSLLKIEFTHVFIQSVK